eukprot:6196810-Pleurochrysis_carterae.AAC.1
MGRTNSYYGSIRKTLSSQGLSTLEKTGSFVDLPPVAIAGIASRVSISGSTSASQQDLQRFFESRGPFISGGPKRPPLFVDDLTIEGGWTLAL